MGLTEKTIFSGLPQVNGNYDAKEIMALRLKTRWGSTLKQHLKPGKEKLMNTAAEKQECRQECNNSDLRQCKLMIFVAVTVTQTFQPATKEAAPAEQKTMGAFHSAQNGMEQTISVRFDRNIWDHI